MKFCFFTEYNRPSFLKGKLSFGKPSEMLEYLVALFKDEEHYCSGSVVSTKHILTAAACLKNFFEKNCSFSDFTKYSALVGSMDLINGGVKYRYKQVEIHKDYSFRKDDFIHNIGLITVLIAKYIFNRYKYIFQVLSNILESVFNKSEELSSMF